MAYRHQGAFIHVRLIVGTDGRPTSCNVQLDSQHPEFRQTACDILMRYARFDPALDANGRPVTSYYTTSIIYQPPG